MEEERRKTMGRRRSQKYLVTRNCEAYATTESAHGKWRGNTTMFTGSWMVSRPLTENSRTNTMLFTECSHRQTDSQTIRGLSWNRNEKAASPSLDLHIVLAWIEGTASKRACFPFFASVMTQCTNSLIARVRWWNRKYRLEINTKWAEDGRYEMLSPPGYNLFLACIE